MGGDSGSFCKLFKRHHGRVKGRDEFKAKSEDPNLMFTANQETPSSQPETVTNDKNDYSNRG